MSQISVEKLLESVGPRNLFPVREGTKGPEVQVPLKLLDSLALTEDLLVCVLEDSGEIVFEVPLLIESPAGKVGIRRAAAGDAAAEKLIIIELTQPNDRFILSRWHTEAPRGERAMGVDQTEESVVVGETAVVKWFTRPRLSKTSCLPRIEALRRASFAHMPAPWLALEWRRNNHSEPILLSYVSSYITDAEDGWTWATLDLQSFLEGRSNLEEATRFAGATGRIIGQMHAAFTSRDSPHATDEAIESWRVTVLEELRRAIELTEGVAGDRLRKLETKIREIIARLKFESNPKLGLTHGDLHVGQILRTPDHSYFVIDFDGNPVESESSEIDADPTAKDLASFVQSIDHVGRVVAKRLDFKFSSEIQLWIKHSQEEFLTAYSRELEILGCDSSIDSDLLLLFQIQQECREYLYAHYHLPHWVYVPDHSLASLVEGT